MQHDTLISPNLDWTSSRGSGERNLAAGVLNLALDDLLSKDEVAHKDAKRFCLEDADTPYGQTRRFWLSFIDLDESAFQARARIILANLEANLEAQEEPQSSPLPAVRKPYLIQLDLLLA